MKWFHDVQKILEIEPEEFLAYLYGQQLDNLAKPHSNSTKRNSVFYHLLSFLRFLIMQVRFKKSFKTPSKVDYYFFSGTVNQKLALESTLHKIYVDGGAAFGTADRGLVNTNNEAFMYEAVSVNGLDFLKVLLLLFVRGGSLWYRLSRTHPPLAISSYFDIFCKSYFYLIYFYSLLKKCNPCFVITANDHNVSNRCLRAVAEHLGIKTVYLQHASVSALFPALSYDYAFLDGQASLDCYLKCESGYARHCGRAKRGLVFLSGQKKELDFTQSCVNSHVGVAINMLDDPRKVLELINELVNVGLEVKLRWHPAQLENDKDLLKKELSEINEVEFSDPDCQRVSCFFSGLSFLVAGNSSIHLEATLIGLRSIYFEFNPASSPDYYGYVKFGVAVKANSTKELISMLKVERSTKPPTMKAIRHYSATYRGKWQNREGELVADTLKLIHAGEPISNLYRVATGSVGAEQVIYLVK